VTTENGQVISYPQLLLAKGSLPAVTILNALTGTDGITLRYDAGVLFPEVMASDEIIACAGLTTGELLIARQFMGNEPIGTLLLKHPVLQTKEVACCYVFVRSGDGKKASDSVYVEVKE